MNGLKDKLSCASGCRESAKCSRLCVPMRGNLRPGQQLRYTFPSYRVDDLVRRIENLMDGAFSRLKDTSSIMGGNRDSPDCAMIQIYK